MQLPPPASRKRGRDQRGGPHRYRVSSVTTRGHVPRHGSLLVRQITHSHAAMAEKQGTTLPLWTTRVRIPLAAPSRCSIAQRQSSRLLSGRLQVRFLLEQPKHAAFTSGEVTGLSHRSGGFDSRTRHWPASLEGRRNVHEEPVWNMLRPIRSVVRMAACRAAEEGSIPSSGATHCMPRLSKGEDGGLSNRR